MSTMAGNMTAGRQAVALEHELSAYASSTSWGERETQTGPGKGF